MSDDLSQHHGLLQLQRGEGCPTPEVWEQALGNARTAAEAFRHEHADGAHAFVDLADAPSQGEAIASWCASAPVHDAVLLAGMGGSALSARVFDGLRDNPNHPRLVVLDTVDPRAVEQAMRRAPDSVLLVGVSKSGGTLETSAVFLTLERWLHESLGADEARSRTVVVCGEDANVFRTHASTQGYATFSIPAGVGGRYSGLSAAGLLPAALGGIDVAALCEGAAWTWARARDPDPLRNPALALTAFHAATCADRPVAVLMPYGERLRALAPWWAQLVGESLGKGGKGLEPVAACGPADQHSLLQLWLEGPDTRVVVTVGAGAGDATLSVPSLQGAFRSEGHPLAAILAAECAATGEALRAAGRPAAHLHLRDADPRSMGAFLMAYELAVVWLAKVLEVNPYGQPAVERGKRAALRRLSG